MIRKENIFSESIIRMDVFFNVPNVKIPMSFAQEGNLRTATTNLIRVSGESFFPIVRHFFHVSRVPKRILNHKEKSYSQRSKLARGRLRLPRRVTSKKLSLPQPEGRVSPTSNPLWPTKHFHHAALHA